MDIDKKELLHNMGARYYDARKAKGYTQEQAAEIAEVTQQSISDSELGKSFLAPDCMLRLCRAYGISCDFLLTGELSNSDFVMLDNKIKNMRPEVFKHYQVITEHFLAATHN